MSLMKWNQLSSSKMHWSITLISFVSCIQKCKSHFIPPNGKAIFRHKMYGPQWFLSWSAYWCLCSRASPPKYLCQIKSNKPAFPVLSSVPIMRIDRYRPPSRYHSDTRPENHQWPLMEECSPQWNPDEIHCYDILNQYRC